MKLEQIKNDYAVTQHYGCWNELLLNNDSFTVGNLHLNKVMEIYAMECLKRASETSFNTLERIGLNDDFKKHVIKNSINNENNIIR